MSQENLAQFFKLLKDNVGIHLDSSKKYIIDSRLGSIAKEQGHEDVNTLLKKLNTSPVGPVHKKAFEALTTNETLFFRDAHVFDALEKRIIPELIEKKRATKSLNIWSAAVSTGQEAYSVSILLREKFPELRSWKIIINASDYSPDAITKAKSGSYSDLELSRGMSDDFKRKYFIPNNVKRGFYDVRDEIRETIRFSINNLVGQWNPQPIYDVVLLRNVLIYFDQETKDKVLQGIYKVLDQKTGCLVLGSSEFIYLSKLFKLVQLEKISYYVPISAGLIR